MGAQPCPVSSIDVGDIRITFLPDGEAHIVATAMFPASDQETWVAHRQWLDGDNRVVNTLGGFLIETGDRKVVVDLGFGDNHLEIPDFAVFHAGRFLDSLAMAGVDPDEVDTVLYTHLHVDHTGWTSRPEGSGRALTFGKAKHVVGPAEWPFWQQPDESGVGPDPDSVLRPLEARLELAGDGDAVAPGVTLMATPGHTPGHQSVVVSSGTDRALILGDVLHCPAQLPEAEWNVLFDVDPVAARKTRDALLAEMDGTSTVLACSHFPDAVFGRVLTGQGKRLWQAVS
jgi:glyoxylase-like metal-dependent hydrolase (beta-lactamase superfamily II)